MTIHPARSNRIATTTGARAILVTVGGVVSGRALGATEPAPAELLPGHVAVRPSNSVGRENVWCDAIR
jgi:hypothetical protein